MSDLLEILSHNAPCDHADINVPQVFAQAKAEIERLTREWDDAVTTINRQGDLLTATVNVLRGKPPELKMWSHHDVAELAAEAKTEIERLTAVVQVERKLSHRRYLAVERLQRQCDQLSELVDVERAETQRLTRENERLRARLARGVTS